MSVFVALALSAYNLSLSLCSSLSFVPVTVFLQLHSVHTAMEMSGVCEEGGKSVLGFIVV